MKILYPTLLVLLLTACGGVKLAAVDNSHLETGKKMYPDLSMAQLENGRNIYSSQCNACHALKPIEKESVEEWKEIVPEMTAKANKKAGTIVINEAQENDLLRYLTTMKKHSEQP